MVFCSILPSEVAIQVFNPEEHYLSCSSDEQGGQHSSPKKKKKVRKKKSVLTDWSGLW